MGIPTDNGNIAVIYSKDNTKVYTRTISNSGKTVGNEKCVYTVASQGKGAASVKANLKDKLCKD